MFGLIKKIYIGLLTGLVNGSNHKKSISLSATLINLHPNECSQQFHYYPFAVKLDRCVGSCNTLNDFSNKICIPSETEDLNLSLFNMITRINESKTLTKQISYEGKCKFDGRKNVIQINDGITINVDVWLKDIMYVKNIIFGILLYVVVKMENI